MNSKVIPFVHILGLIFGTGVIEIVKISWTKDHLGFRGRLDQ